MKTVVAKDQDDEVVTPAVLQRTVALGHKRKGGSIHAQSLRYLPEIRALMVGFADRSAVVLPVENDPELAALGDDDLKRMELGFAGSAVCLDDRDVHVSIAGLIGTSDSLRSMARTVAASAVGSVKSTAKSAASRENGKKGGRPKVTGFAHST